VRELHVVATSEDGRHVVLATRKGAVSGDFRVALDDRLAAAVRGDLPRPGEQEPAGVTPKEIQARLRAGESPEQIAAAAGVPVSKIERYAGPVLSERERVLAQARAGFVTRSRLGASALPLGEAVDRQLTDTTGVRLETVEWSTRREETGSWLVELSYVSQARRRTATWRYDVSRREVTATDSASAALAHVEPSGRRARASEPEHVAAPGARTTARSAGRRVTPVRSAKAASKTAKPVTKAASKAPAARTVVARPAPPVRAAAPVPRSAAPAKAAQTAAARAAAAKAAKAAATKAAKATADKAAKATADKATADKAAKATADKAAKAAKADKTAQDNAAARAAAARAAADVAAAAEAEAARVAEQAPAGPPTLRVVGSEQAPAAARRGPKEPPAAARTAPARAAGQRASVPGWADVLLSTAPVARPTETEPDAD